MTIDRAKRELGFDVWSRIANMGRRQRRAGIECPYREYTAYALAWRVGAETL